MLNHTVMLVFLKPSTLHDIDVYKIQVKDFYMDKEKPLSPNIIKNLNLEVEMNSLR